LSHEYKDGDTAGLDLRADPKRKRGTSLEGSRTALGLADASPAAIEYK